MLFPPSPIQERFSKYCLLLACFFAFSFNHIVLTKYHFVLGQASFYFIALALVTSNFRIARKSILFITTFLFYCLASPAFFCMTGEGLCTTRPYTAAISILFIFFLVEYVAFTVQTNEGFEVMMANYLLYGAWALVILALPDIWTIWRGGVLSSSPYGLDFLSAFGLSPYSINRLRGFTQEPSYLGMVISVLYPICFMRLNERLTPSRLLLVCGLWVCLIYSMSRTGLISCFLISVLILLAWPKRLGVGLVMAGVGAILWNQFAQLHGGGFMSMNWVPSLNLAGLDGSSFVRMSHIIAAFKTWFANPLFGVGLGQSGYVLDLFYPAMYTSASPEYSMWQPKGAFGGIPSFSFLPKFLAELGFLGLLICLIWLVGNLRKIYRAAQKSLEFRGLVFALLGFLIASFGVDGYLYLTIWVIWGLVLGVIRRQSMVGAGKNNHEPK